MPKTSKCDLKAEYIICLRAHGKLITVTIKH